MTQNSGPAPHPPQSGGYVPAPDYPGAPQQPDQPQGPYQQTGPYQRQGTPPQPGPSQQQGPPQQQGQYGQGPYPPAGPPGPPSVKGTSAWAMGFLAYIPIPFLSQLFAGVMMAVQYRSLRTKGPLAEANARHGGNWGLTYVFLTVLFLVVTLACGGLSNVTAYQEGFSVAGQALIGIWAIGVNILHVVLTIMGTVKSNAGKVFANKVQFPFIREPEPPAGPWAAN